MRFQGNIWKEDSFWLVEVPILDAMTQGRTKREALTMIVDLIKTMANKKKFQVEVYANKESVFEIGSEDIGTLLSIMLRRQRQKNGLSLADLAKRLNAKSRNAYARYEQGKTIPTIEKLAELLRAVQPAKDILLIQSVLD